MEEIDPVKTENRYCTACLKTTKHAVKGAEFHCLCCGRVKRHSGPVKKIERPWWDPE